MVCWMLAGQTDLVILISIWNGDLDNSGHDFKSRQVDMIWSPDISLSLLMILLFYIF